MVDQPAPLSRRAALRRIGLFAGLAVTGGLLAACQSGSTAPAAKTEAPSTGSGQAKPTEAPKPAAPAAQPAATKPAEAPKPAEAAKPAAAPATAAPAAKTSGTAAKIVFARTRDNTPTTEKLIETFNGLNKGVTVELRSMPDTSADYRNALVPQLQAKSGEIDVFLTDVIWTAEFAAAGWVDDLTAKFTQQMKAEFLPGPVETTAFQGKHYMIPFWTDAGIFYYRSDLFKELSLEPPKSWDDLVKVGTTVKERKPEIAPYIWQGAVHEGLALNVLEYVWSNGGDVLDEKGEVVLNSPNAVEALEFLTDSIHKHGISPEAVTSSRTVENNQVWFEGRAAMMRSWSFVYGNLAAGASKFALKLDQLAWTALPTGPKGKAGVSCLGGWNCAVNAFSANKDAAWTFIEWLSGFESQKAMAIGTANPMTRKAIYEDKEVMEKVPILGVAQPFAAGGKSRPVTPFYQDVTTSLQRNFHAALTKQASPADAIKRAADELASIQKRLG